jgi:hypothetical protein
MRQHPVSWPSPIEIDVGAGVQVSLDSYANEKALAWVLRAVQEPSRSR